MQISRIFMILQYNTLPLSITYICSNGRELRNYLVPCYYLDLKCDFRHVFISGLLMKSWACYTHQWIDLLLNSLLNVLLADGAWLEEVGYWGCDLEMCILVLCFSLLPLFPHCLRLKRFHQSCPSNPSILSYSNQPWTEPFEIMSQNKTLL